MGLILPQLVETELNGATIGYYELLGYEIPRIYDARGNLSVVQHTKIKVHVLDLTKRSNLKVKVQCDICGKIIQLDYGKYNRNIERNNGLYKCNDTKVHSQVTAKNKLNHLIKCINNFLLKHDRFPKYNEFIKENNFDYGYSKAESICKINNTCLRDVFGDIDCFKSIKPSIKHYNNYLDRLLKIIDSTDLGTNLYELSRGNNCNDYSLPNIRWFIKNCPDKNVSDIPSFKKWAGIYENFLTKDECTNIIIKMSKEYNRLLMYDDFRGAGNGKVSIDMINNYWGTLNKMKQELGLEIVQESMIDKQLSEEETIEQIKTICNYIKKDGRSFTTTYEINSLSSSATTDTLRHLIKKYFNMSLPEYFKQFGIHLGESGRGISFDFDDGEHTTSQFEYMFSKYLRDYGLNYNRDYFRDVRYKEFIPNYNGMMNCDYVINANGKTIYVEIAGIIEAYKNWYCEDKPITVSKSKEKYRLKLKEKEKMLKESNLIYFILFPCDLTRDIFMQIIIDGSLEMKNNIEKFVKNNIDWVKIQNIGELKYKNNTTSCYGQSVVDYTERIKYCRK